MTTQTLDDVTRSMFAKSIDDFQKIERIRKETEAAAKVLAPKLIGKRILKDDKLYEITDIDNGWDGSFRARGYRILGNGKRGSQKWDIGFICARYFDDAAENQS